MNVYEKITILPCVRWHIDGTLFFHVRNCDSHSLQIHLVEKEHKIHCFNTNNIFSKVIIQIKNYKSFVDLL